MTLCATRGLPLYVGMYSADAFFRRDDMLQHISLIVQALGIVGTVLPSLADYFNTCPSVDPSLV